MRPSRGSSSQPLSWNLWRDDDGSICNKNTHGNYLCLADCQTLLRTQQEYIEHLWNYTIMRWWQCRKEIPVNKYDIFYYNTYPPVHMYPFSYTWNTSRMTKNESKTMNKISRRTRVSWNHIFFFAWSKSTCSEELIELIPQSSICMSLQINTLDDAQNLFCMS